MLEPEPLYGLRIVATPAALDQALHGPSIARAAIVVRIAPDEAFLIGASDIALTDPHAIVEPESAFVGWWLTPAQVTTHVADHVEWTLPQPKHGQTQLAQGLVAGMPMKVWYPDPTEARHHEIGPDGPRVLLIVSRGLAHEAQDRLFASVT